MKIWLKSDKFGGRSEISEFAATRGPAFCKSVPEHHENVVQFIPNYPQKAPLLNYNLPGVAR